MEHESTFAYSPVTAPGVIVKIRKMTFGRRCELLGQVGDLVKKAMFFEAGAGPENQLPAAQERHAADAMLLQWAIESIHGLTIDGEEATASLVIKAGPEELAIELVGVIHNQLGLTSEEIKN